MRTSGIRALKTTSAVVFIVLSLALLSSSYAAAQSMEPTTTLSMTGTQGSNGWYRSDVTINLTAVGPSNFAIVRTEYSFNSTGWQNYTGQFNITKEGLTTIYYRSIDIASHVETPKVMAIYIDKTPPTLNAVLTPAPGANGWINRDVQLHYEVSDDVSGLDTRPSDQTLTNEGTYSTLYGIATDKAGNSVGVTVPSFSIDKTAPVIGSLTTSGSTYVDEYLTVSARVEEANPDKLEFDWGDGIGSTASFSNNVARGLHAYKRPGTYTVTLSVKDMAGNTANMTGGISVLSYTITVTPGPTPVPSVTPAPTPVPLPSPTARPAPSAGMLLSAIGLGMAGLILICMKRLKEGQ